jgi:hypothetical protein
MIFFVLNNILAICNLAVVVLHSVGHENFVLNNILAICNLAVVVLHSVDHEMTI